MLFKEIVDGRTHRRTHGRTPDIEGSQKLTEHFVLRWAKKQQNIICHKILQFLWMLIYLANQK